MSGIAGIVQFDRRPASTDALAAMTDTMAHRGPDGINHWTSGSVGLAHCMLRTTSASLVESQPLQAEVGDICLTMDGRVDNREELTQSLGRDRRSLRDVSDAELVLRCYQRWGTGCVARIVGDFAFAIWDGNRRELICGRDFLGKRPFYYSFHCSSFRFGSEPQAVLVDPSVPRDPNAAMAGELMGAQPTSTTETLFRHLFRLPPAHLMVVTAEGVRMTRYWDWDPRAEIRHQTDQEYAAHLLDVCSTAVEARLPSPWPVGVALSGGVDSSSILGVVQHLRLEGRYSGALEIFAMVYPGLACDESSYIDAVAEQHQMAVRKFRPAPVGPAPYEEQTSRYLDLSEYPMTMMHRGYWAAAKQRGCRSLLTGKGPDEWLTGSYYSLVDRLRRGHLRGLAHEIRTEADDSGLGEFEHLWQFGIKPLVPRSVLDPIRSAIGRNVCPAFLRPTFCRDNDLDERLRPRIGRGPSVATAAVAAHLADGWQAHAAEIGERAMSSVGLECRDPFDDRRVIEFALALPEKQRRQGEMTKYVLRQAMTGLIPEIVRTRRDKANYSHLICEELRLQGGSELFVDLVSADLGWVDGHEVLAMYDHLDRNYRNGNDAYHRHLWSLWLIASVDRWLRATV